MTDHTDAKWYDSANPDEMHADLQREYLKTLSVITNRPGLLKHFKGCPMCRAIESAHLAAESAGAVEIEAHRRRKFTLTYSQLHRLLGLKGDQAIVALEIKQDPMSLTVILTGPDEPMTPVDVESSYVQIAVDA